MRSKKQRQITNYDLAKYANQLQPMLENIVKSLGYSLLKLSFVNENQVNYLRLTVNHEDHIVSTNDCEIVSSAIEEKLDLSNSIPFSYMLEVQSPGISNGSNESSEYQFSVKGLNLVVRS